jgi:hypothetical protein
VQGFDLGIQRERVAAPALPTAAGFGRRWLLLLGHVVKGRKWRENQKFKNDNPFPHFL